MSYRLVFNNYSFPVSAEFITTVNIGDSLSLEISPIFKIVNAYRATSEKGYKTYYTRYLSGFIFPLLLLLFSLILLRFQNPGEQFDFILLVLHASLYLDETLYKIAAIK